MSFGNCSVRLQLDPRNVRTTKWSVRKTIWESEQFPACNMTSSRGSLMIPSQGHLMHEQFQEYKVYQLRTLSQKFFSKWKNVQTKHCRKFYSPLSKISLHHETVIYNRLIVFHKLFSWNSVGPSKYSINKIIGSQGHLNIWAVSRVQHEIIQRLFQS